MKNNELPKPHPGTSIPILLNLSVVGLLAGLSFSVQLGLVPMLSNVDAATYLRVMHEIIPTFTQCVKPLMLMGTMTFLVRLFIHRPACRGAWWWTALSFAFFIAGAAITTAGHFPINDRFMEWPTETPPAVLDALRLKWNHLNFWRFVVAQLAFLAALVPVAFGRRTSGIKPIVTAEETGDQPAFAS